MSSGGEGRGRGGGGGGEGRGEVHLHYEQYGFFVPNLSILFNEKFSH